MESTDRTTLTLETLAAVAERFDRAVQAPYDTANSNFNALAYTLIGVRKADIPVILGALRALATIFCSVDGVQEGLSDACRETCSATNGSAGV